MSMGFIKSLLNLLINRFCLFFSCFFTGEAIFIHLDFFLEFFEVIAMDFLRFIILRGLCEGEDFIFKD